MSDKKYIPNVSEARRISIDNSVYEAEKLNRAKKSKGLMIFAYIYTCLAAICIACLVLKGFIPFVQMYKQLFSVMSIIFILLSIKCIVAKTKGDNTYSKVYEGMIENASLNNNGTTTIRVRVEVEKPCKRAFTIEETVDADIIDELNELKLASLPVVNRVSLKALGPKDYYYIDIKVIDGKIVKDNLSII